MLKHLRNPEVRFWLYGIGAAVLMLLKIKGVLSDEEAVAIQDILEAILIVSGAGLAMRNVDRSPLNGYGDTESS